MIVYDFICDTEHSFEGWFKDQDECQRQLDGGQLACPYCDSTHVRRLPSATHIGKLSARRDPASEPEQAMRMRAAQQILQQMHDYVAAHFENVGTEFAHVARRIHCGDEEQRDIRGTATPDEVRGLHEEGIGVLALPPVVAKNKLN